MKVLIFGAGAIGSLLGGLLANGGHAVSFIGRKPHMEAIRQRGLSITGVWGDFHVPTIRVFESLDQIKGDDVEFDLILITVKSFDTRKAVSALREVIGHTTTVASFQNGWGNIELILNEIPRKRFLAGRIITGVDMTPGKVTVTVSADDLVVGGLGQEMPLLSAEHLADTFCKAHIPAKAVQDILSYIWAKLIYNCALNGSCSVLGIPYGEILRKAEWRESLKRIVEECYAVAAAGKVLLNPSDASGFYHQLVEKLIPVTASHFPSMLHDLQKGKQTEINALNGAICRMGREYRIHTPENQRVVDLILKKS